MFVLVEGEGDYYTGKTYIYQGSIFPCLGKIEEAKRYTTYNRADNACNKLNVRVGSYFKVVELQD